MKTMIKSAATLMMILLTNLSFGQGTQLDLKRSIILEGASETEEIVIDVETGTLKLNIFIKSTIKAGELSIEIYDPDNVKQGTFSVGSQLQLNSKSNQSTKNELVNGQLEKKIKEPLTGKWVIKIVPSKAEGTISIVSEQVYADK